MLKTADGTTHLIDPYLGTGDPPRTIRMIPVPYEPSVIEGVGDVFATHEYAHGSSQAPILAETGAGFYGPVDVVAVTLEDEQWPSTKAPRQPARDSLRG